MTQSSRSLPALMLCAWGAGSASVAAGEEESFSPANTLLFASDHFTSLLEPQILRYEYRKGGTLEDGFTDEIRLRVTALNAEGGKDVEIDFLTGARRQYVPPVADARGNPLIMVFLQRDINEMSRLTGGPQRHFQQRIKTALAESAQVRPLTVRFEGREVRATRIRISPYLSDPQRARFVELAHKSYEITLSDEVPGSIYMMSAVVPGEDRATTEDSVPLLEYVLRYQE